MNEKEIIRAAEEAFDMFSQRHNIDVYLEFVNEEEFFQLSSESKIVREEMKEGLPVKVGSLVAHSKDKDTIILCKDVVNLLARNIDFVKALVLHELYHVLYRKMIKEKKINDFIASEERVHGHFMKEFPYYAKLLEF